MTTMRIAPTTGTGEAKPKLRENAHTSAIGTVEIAAAASFSVSTSAS